MIDYHFVASKRFLVIVVASVMLAIVIPSCAPRNLITENFRTDDLDPLLVEAIRKSENYFYLYEPGQTTDYMVSMVRSRVFESPTTRNLGEIVLSLGTLLREEWFDCDEFYAKLTQREINIVNEKMSAHPFVYRDSMYTVDEVVASFPDALSGKINTYNGADAHWAWFMATGYMEPLRRLLDNYLYNEDSCRDCIAWSYSSNAAQNADVKTYVLDYMSQKSERERRVLAHLLPEEQTNSD